MKFPREKLIITIISVLVLALIFAFTTLIVSSNVGDTSVSARSAVLYEPVTDKFLYTKNPDVRLPFASTTKIMTALVAIENSSLDEEISVAAEACGIEGSSLYLTPGEVLSMRELITALMLRSANDAAAAIAYAVAGGIPQFADLMNARALSLGLKDTHFTNPHGLDEAEHYTTARELAIISAEAMRNPEFKKISSTYKATVTNGDGDTRLVVNHNKLLKLYDGAVGIKTGFTKKSGRCLVGAAERNGLTFITVTIDAPDDWSDHEKLFDLGFSTLEAKKLADVGEFTYDLPVLESDKENLTVSNKDEFNIVVPIGGSEITSEVLLPRYAVAPINEGDVLGHVVFKKDGDVIAELPITAESDAPMRTRRGPFSFFKK